VDIRFLPVGLSLLAVLVLQLVELPLPPSRRRKKRRRKKRR
jgi:hypothetical protein